MALISFSKRLITTERFTFSEGVIVPFSKEKSVVRTRILRMDSARETF